MTLFEVLKNDHQEIAMLLNLEEMFFYPVIAQVDETHALTLEAYKEHNHIDQLLQELDDIAVPDDLWIAKFMALKENIEHHIAEEEQKLFSKSRTCASQRKNCSNFRRNGTIQKST